MNTTANRLTTPQPMVSAVARFAAVVGVLAVMAVGSVAVQQASHEAVQSATQTFSNGPAHVTLAPVQIVGRRASADAKSI